MTRDLAICIPTCRRPAQLERLLRALDACEIPPAMHIEVRVIDNDPARTAAPVVEALRTLRGAARELRYDHETRPGVVHARNRAIELGPCDLVAWIDDDEWPARAWLTRLLTDMDENDADAVFGPVVAQLGPNAPGWLRRGRFGDAPCAGPGATADWSVARCGNALMRGDWFYRRGFRFDETFSTSGGEDVDLFSRLDEAGARFTASNAAVYETADGERLTLRWHVGRRVRNGGNYARISARRRQSHPVWLRLGYRTWRLLVLTAIGISPLGWAQPERAVAAVLHGAGLVGFVRGLSRAARD